MKQRLLVVILALCLTLGLLPGTAWAATVMYSGNCGSDNDNVTWSLDSDGVLTISGDGKMGEWLFNYGMSPWYRYRSAIKSVKIEVGVTSIGSWAFNDCSNLTGVTIPDSVTSIGYSAFSSCSSLARITIPNSVTKIYGNPFSGCKKLSTVLVDTENTAYMAQDNILFSKDMTVLVAYPRDKYDLFYSVPDGVTQIGDSAFSNCHGLTNIAIPSSVTSIKYDAFWRCSNLTNVYYSGTEEQWNDINIESIDDDDTSPLFNATIHYNSTGPNEPSVDKPGDLDGDGKVTMMDVMRLARGAANYETLTEQELKLGDIDGDGKITMIDVMRAARSAAGYPDAQ